MNKHSKHRPLMDALEVAIAMNECSPHDMYQDMIGTCDQDEEEIAELKAENERLKEGVSFIDGDKAMRRVLELKRANRELVEALQHIVDEFGYCMDLDKAKDVLAKAKG